MPTLGTTFKERLYLGPLRVVLRRVGIGRALALVSAVRSLGCEVRFRLRPRESVGNYTVFLGRAVGENGSVIGFEPELRSYRRCEENLRLNSLTNVRLFDRALGNEEKEHDLVVDEELGSGVHHILMSNADSRGSGLQRIKVVNGDQFVREQALPVPNVIKVDVEGMEMEVLLGLSHTLRRPECRLICCEVHFALLERMGQKDTPKKIRELLDALGFKQVDWIDPSHFLASKCPSSSGGERSPCGRRSS